MIRNKKNASRISLMSLTEKVKIQKTQSESLRFL